MIAYQRTEINFMMIKMTSEIRHLLRTMTKTTSIFIGSSQKNVWIDQQIFLREYIMIVFAKF